MKKKLWIGLATGLMMLGMAGVAGATLTTIGTAGYGGSSYNLIWDANNNGNSVVWLDYSHAGDTWYYQQAWAAGLNGAGVLSYNLNPAYHVDWGTNNWRLPATVDGAWSYGYDGTTTGGYNITTSEMGHLYYTELGNKGYDDKAGNGPQAGWGLTRVGDFSHLTASWYWSGTEYAADPYTAWTFDVGYGAQYIYTKGYGHLDGLAVRSGQVTYSGGATPTPEPATMLLLGTGLAGLAGGRMKRRRGRAA